jgi:hypothetical protein
VAAGSEELTTGAAVVTQSSAIRVVQVYAVGDQYDAGVTS